MKFSGDRRLHWLRRREDKRLIAYVLAGAIGWAGLTYLIYLLLGA